MTKPLRSQLTRDRILRQARRLFAESGYERTTVRMIAQSAKVNPSMVMRYYGSKEDLFAVAARVDFRMPDFATVPVEARGSTLVRHMLEQWESGDELPALLRAAGAPAKARARLVQAVEQQAAPAIRVILPEHSREALAMIVMHLAGVALSRYVLKHPSVTALDRETLVAWLGASIQKYFSE